MRIHADSQPNTPTPKRIQLLVVLALLATVGHAQRLDRIHRELAEAMLANVDSDVRHNYYDPKLHGLDWDAMVGQAKVNIQNAPDIEAAFAQIEGVLERLEDSHTRLYPPRYDETMDYGIEFEMVGNRSFITGVKAGSDAESQGVKRGDEVLSINGFTVDRSSINQFAYAMNVLAPRDRLVAVLRDPSGKVRRLTIMAHITHHSPTVPLDSWWINQNIMEYEAAWDKDKAEYRELGPELMVLRIPAFVQPSPDIDSLYAKARAHQTLIVDLRGNPGGRLDSVERFLNDLFDHEVTIGQYIERKKTAPITVKGDRRGAFQGKLIVLVDSQSTSASEIFARTVQLQKRGIILGDLSGGKVMAAEYFQHENGMNPVFFYATSITVANITMSDGKSLERVGVTPDQVLLPTAGDLAAGLDPVLSYAASLADVALSPHDAATLFQRPSPGN